MVSTWVNIENDREIIDAVVDEELEFFNNMSVMDIDVYDDDFLGEDISLEYQKYMNLESMEAIDVMRDYMTENDFPPESFNILDILHWTAQQKRFKGKKNNLPIILFSAKNNWIKYTYIHVSDYLFM